MSSVVSNSNRGGTASSSGMPPLGRCLHLKPIAMGNQLCMSSGELSKVLGVPKLGRLEDNSLGLCRPKPMTHVVKEELKHFQECVRDDSRKAMDRAKKLDQSIVRLDKYAELSSKKRRQYDLAPGDGLCGLNFAKMGSQVPRNPLDVMAQRLEERPKRIWLNKHACSSMSDADGMTASVSRQQMLTERNADSVPAKTGSFVLGEEKMQRLTTKVDGWETNVKRKRSVATVGNRGKNGDQDVKRTVQSKLTAALKLRSCDSQGFRSKCTPGIAGFNKFEASMEPDNSGTSTTSLNGIKNVPFPRDRSSLPQHMVITKGLNKANFQDDNPANCSCFMLNGKVSRAPRSGSDNVSNSLSKVQSSSVQPGGSNKFLVAGVAKNQKIKISPGSSTHNMARWVGQRPHKSTRSRRRNLVSPILDENQISPQDYDFSSSTTSETSASWLAKINNDAPRFKREWKNASSPFGLSEIEESEAGDEKVKDNNLSGGDHKAKLSLSTVRKNKILGVENDNSTRRQEKNGGCSSSMKPGFSAVEEKPGKMHLSKPLESTKATSDKKKTKSGPLPSKMVKLCKAMANTSSNLNNISSDLMGESDGDHEDLLLAANTAQKANGLALSSSFWKKMEYVFASVSSEDISYLKLQLSIAEDLDESLSRASSLVSNIMGGEQVCDANREPCEIDASVERSDKRSDKATPLYQRVLSALIKEDDAEESIHNMEGKNMTLHCTSDDSHRDSCNYMDVEPKDRDRIKSGDRNLGSNSYSIQGLSNKGHNIQRWLGDDDFSLTDFSLVSEMSLNDLGHQQSRDISIFGVSTSSSQYQHMCMDDRLLMELQSIGLYPEQLPDLADMEDISQDIGDLKEGLEQQIQTKRKTLGRIEEAVMRDEDVEGRQMEPIAMDQLVEMAYRKRLGHRGSSALKIQKAPRQAALAFIKRTLSRYRKFEETGNSCFGQPAFQDTLFASPSNDAKSNDYVGSEMAGDMCNEASNRCKAEAMGSGKKREASINDGSGDVSLRTKPSLNSNIPSDQKTKTKSEQKSNRSNQPLEEPTDNANLRSHEFDSIEGQGVSNELGGHHNLGNNWLDFEADDNLQDIDCEGLDVPMDDLNSIL